MIRGLERFAEISKCKEDVKAKFMERLHLSSRAQKNQEAKDAKDAADDLPAKLAAQRLKDHQDWIDRRQTAQLATQAGETQRQHIQDAVGRGNKLSPTTDLPSLPYEGIPKEEMTDHQRIERGAAVS
ncbi:hypothetical protein CROQUDRAFT_40836 [Cronartium quercuum f. sp. fusiforme G11]|uniref:Uncharacterized protein n=1 Tax=Cronartium quercuum f. sp. fusiforme G11 TaxID=708437 RepID=A0A9P6TFI6_9BASI|nr:hypothetical protein CROQUDRAFT_40836 [Cronartium quercuum f. sp. fusiforme G11]